MERTLKQYLCIILSMVLLLSLLPVGTLAASTTSVYCQAPDSWSQCYIHYWGSGETTWPGEVMSQDADGIWCYEVPSDAAGLIFNNGNGTQTANLTVPTDDKVMYVFANNYWTTYGKVEVVTEYFVAGTASLCGVDWQPGAAQNKMTEKDGIYTISYTGISAGTHRFKVTNGTWDQSWGKDAGNDDYVLELTEETNTVEIQFDPAVPSVDVIVNGSDSEENVIAEGTATFASSVDAWNNPAKADFVPAADGTVKIEIIACDPGFYVESWVDNEWIEDYVGVSPTVIEIPVTAGCAYGFDISSGIETVVGSDRVAGSVTYKITADVAAGESGPEAEPQPIPVPEIGMYIEAGQTVWFIHDIYDHMITDGVYSQMLNISASVPYAVTYRGWEVPVDVEGFVSYEMIDMTYTGQYIFSVTNNGADAFFFIEVKDRPTYVISEIGLTLGDNMVVPNTDYDRTLYEFFPETTGVYSFTISNGVIGNWGSYFNPMDLTGTKDTSLQWTCTTEGQSVMIGVAETEEAVLTVERIGDYAPGEDVILTVYENTYGFTYQLPEDPKLVKIDVLDDQADVAVLDKDGFYRYGSQDGPLMVADLNEFPINLADAYIYGQLRAYIRDNDGNVIAKYDYNEAMNEYLEAGLVPVTEELATMLQQIGDHHSWWQAGGFVFEGEAPEDASIAWMTACSYIMGIKVYCATGWEKCYVFTWDNENVYHTGPWPGTEMNKVGDLWEFVVPTSATKIIFNNGSGVQTDDLDMPTDNKVKYDVAGKAWAEKATEVQPAPVTYVVAGTPELCGIVWDAHAAANAMTFNGSEYEKVYYNVPAGEHSFKITNGTQWWGNEKKELGEDNILLNMTYDDTVIIKFNPTTLMITVTANGRTTVYNSDSRNLAILAPASWTNVYIYTWEPCDLGDFPGTQVPKVGRVYETTVKNTMVNLVVSGDQADGTRKQTDNITLLTNGEDVTVSIADDGSVTVTYGPSGIFRVVGNADWMGSWDPESNAGLMERLDPGVYQKQFKNVAPGSYEFRVVRNGDWGTSWGNNGDNYCFTVTRTCDVTVTFLYGNDYGYIYVDCKTLPGDVSGDGKLNTGDVAKLYAHIRNTAPITDEETLLIADFNNDGKVNIGDTARLYAYIRGTDPTSVVDAAYRLDENQQLSKDSTLTGKVLAILEPYNSKYGWITVSIAVEDREHMPIICTRLTGEDVVNISENDIITVTGRLRNFYGTVEFKEGCQLLRWEQILSYEEQMVAIVEEAYALGINEIMDRTVTLTGRVISIDQPYNGLPYISVTIVVEGKTDKPIYCYRLMGSAISDVEVGYDLKVTGTLRNYYGNVEFMEGCQILAMGIPV